MRIRDIHHRAAQLIASGASIELTAMQVGVAPSTVRRWRRSPMFGQIEAEARAAVQEERERTPPAIRRGDAALQAHDELLLLARTAPDKETRINALALYVEHAMTAAATQARRDVLQLLAEVIQTTRREGA